MQQLSFKNKLKMFSLVMLVCFIGIIASSFMIDKKIDSYIADLKSVNNIYIDMINNTDNEITIKEDGDTIHIYVDPKEEDIEVTESIIEPTLIYKYVKVTSEIGLNIRSKPSIASEKVGVINYGDSILVTEDYGDWYKTDLGFIYKKFTS